MAARRTGDCAVGAKNFPPLPCLSEESEPLRSEEVSVMGVERREGREMEAGDKAGSTTGDSAEG